MPKIKFFIVAVIILISLNINAAEYKIVDFLPDSLNTWQLYGTGEFQSATRHYENSYTKENNSKSKGFQIYPSAFYNYLKVRKSYELRYSLQSRYRYSHNNSEKDNDIKKIKDYQQTFSLNSRLSTIKYLYKNLGLIGDLNIDFTYHNRYDNSRYPDSLYKNNVTAKYFQPTINIVGNPGVSYGRIYSAKYSAKAYELIHEIRKSGFLLKELTKNQFIELSQIILDKQTEYHYDNRIKKMESLEEIISFLRKIGAVEQNELRPVLITEDIYSYDLMGELLPRKFGFQYYVKGLLGYTYTKRQNNYRNESINLLNNEINITKNWHNSIQKLSDMGISTGINFSKIRSWNFFYNVGLELTYNKPKYRNITDHNNSIMKYKDNSYREYISASFLADIYYQFNSRSYFRFNNEILYRYNLEASQIRSNMKIDDSEKYESYLLHLSPHFVYFVTPKMMTDINILILCDKHWRFRDYDDVTSKKGHWQCNTEFSVNLFYYL